MSAKTTFIKPQSQHKLGKLHLYSFDNYYWSIYVFPQPEMFALRQWAEKVDFIKMGHKYSLLFL